MKFRRKADPSTAAAEEESDASADPVPESAPVGFTRDQGPFDRSEVELEENDPTRIDLGGLLVTGREGLELRMQVDEASQQVVAVLLVSEEGAVELRPFAAPRNGDLWSDVRRDIAAESARRGGTATEADGPFGPELQVVLPVKTADGRDATQPSRVIGVNGPRWLLRATLLGKPAMDPSAAGPWEDAVRAVIVNRGDGAMSPGEALPLTLPANARRAG